MGFNLRRIIERIHGENLLDKYRYAIIEYGYPGTDRVCYHWVIIDSGKLIEHLKENCGDENIKGIWLSNSKIIEKILKFMDCMKKKDKDDIIKCLTGIGKEYYDCDCHRDWEFCEDGSICSYYREVDVDCREDYIGRRIAFYDGCRPIIFGNRPEILDNTVQLWDADDYDDYCHEIADPAQYYEDCECERYRHECEREPTRIYAVIGTNGIYINYNGVRRCVYF